MSRSCVSLRQGRESGPGYRALAQMHNGHILFNILMICSYILMQNLCRQVFIYFYLFVGARKNCCLSF